MTATDANAANPTTTFQRGAIVHAVITTQNAPASTVVKTRWYAIDVGTIAPCNTLIGEAELTEITNSSTLDFQQGPIEPTGSYRIELYVIGTLDRVLNFTVR